MTESTIKAQIIAAANACDSKDFTKDNYDASYVKQLNSSIDKWLKLAKPTKIEIYVDKVSLNDVNVDKKDIIDRISNTSVKFVKLDIEKMYEIGSSCRGNVDIYGRELTIWDDGRFVTGSDGGWYIYVDKIA